MFRLICRSILLRVCLYVCLACLALLGMEIADRVVPDRTSDTLILLAVTVAGAEILCVLHLVVAWSLEVCLLRAIGQEVCSAYAKTQRLQASLCANAGCIVVGMVATWLFLNNNFLARVAISLILLLGAGFLLGIAVVACLRRGSSFAVRAYPLFLIPVSVFFLQLFLLRWFVISGTELISEGDISIGGLAVGLVFGLSTLTLLGSSLWLWVRTLQLGITLFSLPQEKCGENS